MVKKTKDIECQVAGCAKKVTCKKRKLCATHNDRWLQYGDLYADVPIKQGVILATRRKALQAKHGYRYCRICKKTKKIKEFDSHKSGSYICRFCIRDVALRKVHGIGILDYTCMLKKQKGKCALCKTENPGSKNLFFSIDHDHQTGRIRGLLCNKCNLGIGVIERGKIPITRLVKYLKKVS